MAKNNENRKSAAGRNGANKPVANKHSAKKTSPKSEWVYGLHAVKAIFETHPERALELYVLDSRHDDRIDQILSLAKGVGVFVGEASKQELEKRAGVKQHQGVVARVRLAPVLSDADLALMLDGLSEAPFLLVLDMVTDPHNLGACLRSADAAGVHAVIAPKDKSVGLNNTVKKVAVGAAETVPFYQVTNLARCIRDLKDRNIWCVGAALDDAAKGLYEADLKGPLALVLGAEGEGLRRLTKEHCDQLLYIPMAGAVSSLNVSVAAGICMFEAVRQRSTVS